MKKLILVIVLVTELSWTSKGIILPQKLCHTTVSFSSFQVYPCEYAYHVDSVSAAESLSANCRRYPGGLHPGGGHSDDYIHCDGTPLILADSNFGQEQYQPTDYYVWSSTSGEQLLFIFPTRVSLTTITLHYYSDSDQGLPRLIFYAVPDYFDVWDAPAISDPRVGVAAVPPLAGGEPAGSRSVSINVNINTKKLLMFKHDSTTILAVSEVQFFTCSGKFTVMIQYHRAKILDAFAGNCAIF